MSSDKTPASKPSSRLARFFGLGDKRDDSANESAHKDKPAEDTPIVPESVEETVSEPVEDTAQVKAEESSQEDAEALGTGDDQEAVQSVPAEENTDQIEEQSTQQEKKKGLLTRWREGLGKTRQGLGSAFGSLLSGRYKIDEDLIEEIETLLLTADVGIETTAHLIELFREKVKKDGLGDGDLMQLFKGLLVELLESHAQPLLMEGRGPDVIMMVGVNGVGKTTSIGKLAKKLQVQGKSVILAAGDTFRAAAVEQLQVWGERNQIPVIAQKTGSDSASVIYDALHSALAKGADVLIADTAGRLHNKSNLMEELGKVVRVLKKLDETAPHEILLVLDAATGQNALSQAREFCKTVPVTGLILTKLDGTAKGGVAFSLVQQLQLPVKFVGLGEGIDDLTEFNPVQFVDALFDS